LERENLELEKFLEQGGNLGITSIPQEDVERYNSYSLTSHIKQLQELEEVMITRKIKGLPL